MANLHSNNKKIDLGVQHKFASYPKDIHILLNNVRELIFSVAEQEGVFDLTESLKWGEPSYTSKIGSTIRYDWKAKFPDQYCLYFNCKTSLIETFKEVYGDTFTYQGNRALIFNRHQNIPVKQLAHCISMSLRYKNIKHLALLGA